LKNPLFCRVEENYVGGGAWRDTSLPFEVQRLGGASGEEGQNFGQRHFVLEMKDLDRETECGFEAGDAVGGSVELLLFFVGSVGGVVGGDGVDGAVEEAFDHGGSIGSGAEGRVHLRVGVVVADAVFGEREVVGRDLAGDVQALFACCADGVEGFCGGEMSDVEMAVLHLPEKMDVAFDEAGFGFDGHAAEAEAEGEGACVHGAAAGEARVFCVLDDGEIEFCGCAKSLEHDGVAEDGAAVIGDGYCAGIFECGIVGQCFAEGAACCRCDGVDAD